MDNENKSFYDTMIFLLVETLKNASSNIAGDVRIFFRQRGEVVSIVLGLEYSFKNLELKPRYFFIKLCNKHGKYDKYMVFYRDVVGFCSDVIYILYLNHECDYIYPDQHLGLSTKLSNLFNEQVKISICHGHRADHTIKITFFEQFPAIEIPKSLCTGDKLLVLFLEPGNWHFKLEKEGVRIIFSHHSVGDVYLPYNSIVTYFNNGEGLFLNRNVKIVEEDFQQEDNYVQDGNVIYVNFKEILREEIDDDINMLNFFSYFSHNSSSKTVEHIDNLIIGNFSSNNKKEDIE